MQNTFVNGSNTVVNGTIIGTPTGYSPGLLAQLLPSNEYAQTNLVSDGSVPAATIDPNLINPWGVSFSSTSPYWVSDNGAGVTTFYNGAGAKQTIAGQTAVTIAAPPGHTTPSTPTGQVFNFANTGFNISGGGTTAPAIFLFATQDGTISGWNPSVNPASSVIAVDNSQAGAVYTGLAIGQTQNGTFLYAADFSKGTVDMFNSNFQQVGSFTDPNVPAGFAPFNVQVLGGNLFVTFALQDAAKTNAATGPGNGGFVDEFSLSGQLVHRVANTSAQLDSPWDSPSRPRASDHSATISSSAISATARSAYIVLLPPLSPLQLLPLLPLLPLPTFTSASWTALTLSRFRSPVSGPSSPATTAPAATRTTSTSPQAFRTTPTACLAR